MEDREKSFETRLGTFTLRRETVMDQLKIGRLRRVLLGAGGADAFDFNFAHSLAGIEVLSVKKPDDLPLDPKTGQIDWDQIVDVGAITDLWRDYQDWEATFLVPPETSGDSGESS